jgi:hypothetical protein
MVAPAAKSGLLRLASDSVDGSLKRMTSGRTLHVSGPHAARVHLDKMTTIGSTARGTSMPVWSCARGEEKDLLPEPRVLPHEGIPLLYSNASVLRPEQGR